MALNTITFENVMFLVVALIIVAYIITIIINSLPTEKRKREELQRIAELKSIEKRIDEKKDNIQLMQAKDINQAVKAETAYQKDMLTAKEDFINKELQSHRKLKKEHQQEYIKQKEEIQQIVNEKSQTYPWLANLYADYLMTFDEEEAERLRNKSRPAEKAAETVQRIAREKRELNTKCKLIEHQLLVYENLFPWLLEYKELTPEDAAEYAQVSTADENEYTILKNWLSPEEYNKLPAIQKYQLALDRYNSKQKSKWQIGIDYERFIGYQYEQLGYKVKYNGALQGLEDMGRDLIASKDNTVLVIQCKRWAKEKTIHEKHIFQLYGSMTLAKRENSDKTIKGVFVTTTYLSPVAKDCANILRIKVIENKHFEPYPQIKCNISKTGEKIYHLPFDQQYDTTMINPKDGDFYATTVQEAEDAGFRRAWRWHDNT